MTGYTISELLICPNGILMPFDGVRLCLLMVEIRG